MLLFSTLKIHKVQKYVKVANFSINYLLYSQTLLQRMIALQNLIFNISQMIFVYYLMILYVNIYG